MPVKVRCTSCDKVLTVPDTARGKAVKCPGCQQRIAVPDEDSSSVGVKVPGKGGGDKVKKKPAKPTKPADSEDALASFDLSRAEDTNARICNKCGFDMKYQDEEDTECPKCGFDAETGGQGKKATKKAMRGPDPADFYPGLAKSSWKFVLKNMNLAWRTAAYVAVCLLISMLCALAYLYLSQVPPRAFFALCFTVAVALPVMIVPLGVGIYLVNFAGSPPWVMGVCAGIGLIPVVWLLPVTMSHMSMPVSTPGWMVWKIVPLWLKSIKPLSVWLMWLFLTTLPLTGAAAAVGAVWGNDIVNIVNTMEANATTERTRAAAASAPKGKNAPPQADPSTIGQILDVDLKPLIAPAIILLVMCLPVGFIAMFNMRINGQFTYFNKNRLEMVDKRKEYKYVAKIVVGEDGEVVDMSDKSGKDIGLGVIVALFGLAVSGGGIYKFLVPGVPGMDAAATQGAAYQAGVWTGVGFGVLLVIAGILSIVKGVQSKKSPSPPA